MSNPTTRLLALLELLQSHELISGAELARRLDIEPRTLRRYIQSLETLGIPVTAERGRDGGYRLMKGFKLPPMMFTNEEALALGVGMVASRNLGLANTPANHSALSKLERVMPDPLKRRLRSLGETVTLDMQRGATGGDPEIIATISAAARDQQQVRLNYRSPGKTATERRIDPYQLAYWGGHWYTVGYCHLRKDIRSFRLDRMLSVEPIAASFGRPEDFDALTYISEAIAALPRSHRVKVTLHTDLTAAGDAIFSTFGTLTETTDGTQLTVQADDLDWVARELCRLPFSFNVIEPLALIDVLVRHVKRIEKACRNRPATVR